MGNPSILSLLFFPWCDAALGRHFVFTWQPFRFLTLRIQKHYRCFGECAVLYEGGISFIRKQDGGNCPCDFYSKMLVCCGDIDNQ